MNVGDVVVAVGGVGAGATVTVVILMDHRHCVIVIGGRCRCYRRRCCCYCRDSHCCFLHCHYHCHDGVWGHRTISVVGDDPIWIFVVRITSTLFFVLVIIGIASSSIQEMRNNIITING